MDIYCPVDERCSAVISALLEPLPPLKIQEYYERLLASRNCSTIQVKLDGEFGKGVYAQQDFAEGELIFRDQMLFGCQHPSNKIECMEDAKKCSIADADWDSCHSLLCLGEKSKAPSRAALDKFTQHANETNDIFLLAAKAIAYTILRYRKLKTSCERKRKLPDSSDCFDLSLLREAWRPISMGHKRRWWECMALPEDVDSSEEVTFRMQIKELAFQSLQLLKDAIYDKECEALFSLELYGQIIGMFELNNLDLVVASPVEDYFLYIDDLHSPEKEEVEKVSHQFLDALGEEYAVSCEGTAFFPIQSCMNHSCQPNARAFKREEDRDGEATILACKPIHKGEEITISYIDESLPFEERRAALPDYGFTCRCSKCQEES
ncbi:hypothetical protein MLD38_033395 [Melastoma candidum]|uniref:Uncharacterized protein n=1 Tax=Melastoma candidum TaxID=119954 RepID=A0ACB9M6E9_9MYRT|nr:hypothetical protein MLD38_033395 [Melastoma candidum]